MKRRPISYINRELSWLEFNQRVLDQARDPSVPLLERVRFLAITASNLDEFFMVRVGGLRMLEAQGVTKPDPSGQRPLDQLRIVRERASRIVHDQYQCYLQELEPGLTAAGIRRIRPDQCTDLQARRIGKIIKDEVFPVLTPMAVGPDTEFPLLANQTLGLCVRLAPAREAQDAEPRFAVIPLAPIIPRFLSLPIIKGYEYMLLEDAVKHGINQFFPGEEVLECVPFRITRNADLSVREDQAFDLLKEMQEVLDARKLSACARLEISAEASNQTLRFLRQHLEVTDRDIYQVEGPLALAALHRLADLREFDHLKNPPWPPQPSPLIDRRSSMFELLSSQDMLLHHPFESYEPVLRLLEEAADDPNVLAIKQILYRTSRNSPVVAALERAAKKGKHVTVLVELKARFDEARNIAWARDLEQEGAQVIYGVKGLKTHAKLCLIVRREPQGIQRYVHFGTGNYNEATARLYTDVSYMTAEEELGADATSLFNAISGYSQPLAFRKISAAPIGLREKLIEMIEVETEQKRQGRKALIIAKLNSLSDTGMIEALYSASQAGVKIQLIVRGICCLRPGVAGLSENITVTSIVDRFLEHSRIFYFWHGGDERVFISSADWMSRNLDRRVELLVPVEDPASRNRLIEILQSNFHDTVKALTLQPDGHYARVKPVGRRKAYRSQEELYREACQTWAEAEQTRRNVFEPHLAPSPMKNPTPQGTSPQQNTPS